MLDNLGDAYEAIEECHGMIWWLARQVAGARAERQQVLAVIEQARVEYEQGSRWARNMR